MTTPYIDQVQFRIAGNDDRIPTLGESLGGFVDAIIVRGQQRAGGEAQHHFISLRIWGGLSEQGEPNQSAARWLEEHQLLLADLVGDKWLDFSTYLREDQAYESWSFSLELMQAAVEAQCQLRNTCYAFC
jgi:hypothetical protein